MNRFLLALTLCAAVFIMGCSELGTTANQDGQCTFCHIVPPQGALHAVHADTMGIACNVCHAGVGMPENDVHANGAVNVAFEIPYPTPKTAYYDPVLKTCNLVYCHGTISSADSTSISMDAVNTGCVFCHERPPAGNFHAVHSDSMGYGCDVCHPVPGSTKEATHINGMVDIAFSLPFPAPRSASYDAAGHTCNLVYCHGTINATDSTSVDRDALSSGCGFCHDLTALRNKDHHSDDYISPTVFNNCGRCHEGYVLNTATVNDSIHINGSKDTYNCDACHESRVWGQ